MSVARQGCTWRLTVRRILLNRPERLNAITDAFIEELHEAIDIVEHDAACRFLDNRARSARPSEQRSSSGRVRLLTPTRKGPVRAENRPPIGTGLGQPAEPAHRPLLVAPRNRL